ncbi:terpene synthase family protein [Streptomyces sp. NBC_01166]|uniref:terpene synthase family protein n=1 Tax=Streptomyces sp. NBC_01166 TaxID=2903755 RepID=UPI0038698133|nr:terpene synthase family protein [Streptomyces sp. NBC_01166]
MSDSASTPQRITTVLRWARGEGLVADAHAERRLLAMRLEVLAGRALPRAGAADVMLTAQWAAFICWVDDHIDRQGLGSRPGELEGFTAPLRKVLEHGGQHPPTAPHAVVLWNLWRRTAPGMSDRWRARFACAYNDFLDASEQEVALRRSGVRLPLSMYVRLRRRTITLLPMLAVLESTGRAPMVEGHGVEARLRGLGGAVADVAGWANDLASYANDIAAGQDNLVAVIAREDGCSTLRARARVTAMIEERREGFRTAAAALRSDCAVAAGNNSAVGCYVDMVETFMAATLHWLAVTGRFVTP